MHVDSNTSEKEPTRSADCYLFYLIKELVNDKANILDTYSREFYLLLTKRINYRLII